MNALQAQFILGTFKRRDVGALSVSDITAWLLPTMTAVSSLPTVPDGSVSGRPYIPNNTTVDVVGNTASMQTSAKRIIGVSAAVGLLAGIVGGYVAGRHRRK